MIRTRRRATGFSLPELMVALALLVIVMAQLSVVLMSQQESYLEQESVSETQQDVRLLVELLLSDLRMGGFMVPRQTGVGSIDGGNAAADVLCMSDPAALAPNAFVSATNRFEGAAVTNVLTGANATLTLLAGDLDIDGDGTNDFTVGNGILISDGARVHCAAITAIAGGSITFAPATPVGAGFVTSDTLAVPAIVYTVAGTSLTRNGLPLSTFTEDLQVEFGVDADGDGLVGAGEFPIHDLTGSDLASTKFARVHLTTRVAVEDADFTGVRTAAANRVAGAADGFRRRKVTADTRLRNVL